MIRDTSVEAYDYLVVSGKLAKANRAVYMHLWHEGPTTQKRTERALGDRTYTMRPRFIQLERMGLIRIVGRTKCEETGRTNLMWDVTSQVNPLPRNKISTNSRLKELKILIKNYYDKADLFQRTDELRDIYELSQRI